MSETERGFTYLRINEREGKPRTRGITEIRCTIVSLFCDGL